MPVEDKRKRRQKSEADETDNIDKKQEGLECFCLMPALYIDLNKYKNCLLCVSGKAEATKSKETSKKTQSKADETCADDKKQQGLTDAFNCLLNLSKENVGFKIPVSFSLDHAQSCPQFVNIVLYRFVSTVAKL